MAAAEDETDGQAAEQDVGDVGPEQEEQGQHRGQQRELTQPEPLRRTERQVGGGHDQEEDGRLSEQL